MCAPRSDCGTMLIRDTHAFPVVFHLDQGARDACYDFETRLDAMGFYGEETNQRRAAVRGNLRRFVETVDGRCVVAGHVFVRERERRRGRPLSGAQPKVKNLFHYGWCGFICSSGRFAAKRRRTLLQQARDMTLGDYHNTVEVRRLGAPSFSLSTYLVVVPTR